MNLAKYQCMICGREHLLDQYCVCHTWSFSKPLKDLPLKDPCPYKSYDELEQELAEAKILLSQNPIGEASMNKWKQMRDDFLERTEK